MWEDIVVDSRYVDLVETGLEHECSYQLDENSCVLLLRTTIIGPKSYRLVSAITNKPLVAPWRPFSAENDIWLIFPVEGHHLVDIVRCIPSGNKKK